jgi:hypothetical protein
VTATRCDAGALELGAGLEALVSAALASVEIGGEVDVTSHSRASAYELTAWARGAGHEVVGEAVERAGGAAVFVVRVRRGRFGHAAADVAELAHGAPQLLDGRLATAALRAAVGRVPAHAGPRRALAPLGAAADELPRGRGWALSDRDRVWADGLAQLADRSARQQWDATTDIPWETARALPRDVERAVSQVMTYIAQNEYAAYYVPARYLADVNPEYIELLMWLASHVHDEARHIEVFTKRALAGGMCAPALASTDLSLQTLFDERDFTIAALLLNVLGEGTFMDLLRFVELHAPDAASRTAARLTRRDEQRHVRFGIAHVRQRLSKDPDERSRLVAAVEARATKLTALEGPSPAVTESLVLMASRSRAPAEVAEAGQAVRDLLSGMHEHRQRRLRAAGFDLRTARHLSELHTPNLM